MEGGGSAVRPPSPRLGWRKLETGGRPDISDGLEESRSLSGGEDDRTIISIPEMKQRAETGLELEDDRLESQGEEEHAQRVSLLGSFGTDQEKGAGAVGQKPSRAAVRIREIAEEERGRVGETVVDGLACNGVEGIRHVDGKEYEVIAISETVNRGA
uniref:Uncharacterized protein n=1 Tax=Compsopogon caeruleus TaxID=31354 RepID=A0A7S1T633_9RHOD|mmetsp:Transcript_11438/g.23219  ORF Transcript_11438/g.23219 Transcript_11438/m.23219 type:complete len:157 (+) Transcript_11438:304-774(+)